MRRVARCLIGTVVLAAAVVGTGSGVAVAADAVFNVSPTSGAPGTVVDVRFRTTCPRPAGSQSATATVTLSQTGGQAVATATTTVSRRGRWSVQITVPVGTPAGAYVVSARCSTPSGTYLTYAPSTFTVTGSPPPPPPPPAVTQISSDPFTNPTSQHQTQVEPDTLADGNTIVSAFQSGRFTDGGSSDIGWATSTDGGATWAHGFLPSLTVNSTPAGTYSRVTDPSVAFDRRHGVWVISGLAMNGSRGAGVTASRSADGITWSAPVVVASTTSGNYDKEWAVCDTHPASPYYGNCYVTFDDNAVGDRILNTTSADGGLTWGPLKTTADNAFGFGGQPLVQPGGTVVVPFLGPTEAAIGAYRSLDGGASWTTTSTISPVSFHPEAGGLRSSPLPTAEIDGNGRVFVAWSDCRFRGGCAANDIVMSTSTDGASWSAVARVPIDAVSGPVDHFIPGLAVDPSTAGAAARLGLTYYYYPNTSCSFATCELDVGSVSSSDGGATWSAPARLNPAPMSLGWLAGTTQGYMVGDYISASFVGGRAVGVFALATAPTGTFHESMYAAPLP